MGWTHSWRRPTELPSALFAKASIDCQKIMTNIGIPLAGFDGTGTPIFSHDTIVFNGLGDERYEPFEIHQTEFDRHGRPSIFQFCKTNHAPYDLCVKVALVILNHYMPDELSVSSDGKESDWDDARKICLDAFGFGDGFRLTTD